MDSAQREQIQKLIDEEVRRRHDIERDSFEQSCERYKILKELLKQQLEEILQQVPHERATGRSLQAIADDIGISRQGLWQDLNRRKDGLLP